MTADLDAGAADLAAGLRAAIADLDGYIERRAAERAAPLIAEARAEATEKIAQARAELQRQQDLIAEMRRVLGIRDQQLAQWLDHQRRGLCRQPLTAPRGR
jgi:hypothetical protein